VARSRLQIPEDYQPILADLLSLSDESIEKLNAAVTNLPPGPHKSGFSNAIADRVGISNERAWQFVMLLGMLLRVRDQMELGGDAFIAAVEAAALSTEEANLHPPAVDWQRARRILGSLLDGTPSLGLTSKAADLLAEHSRVFCTARILTDLRPVFSSDVGVRPASFLIIHKLRLGYFENGELHHAYFALDDEDIVELQKTLNRAARKAKTLTEFVTGTGASVLDALTHGD